MIRAGRRRAALIVAGLGVWIGACSPSSEGGAGFRPYPGATLDAAASEEADRRAAAAGQPNKRSRVYVTEDAFDLVDGFYAEGATRMSLPPLPPEQAATDVGARTRRALFVLDGASDLRESRSWVTVQRPFWRDVVTHEGRVEFVELKDVTVIVVVEKE